MLGATMPEATIYEDGHSCAYEDNVGPNDAFLQMNRSIDTETEAPAMKL
jgi:hypothetical protein